MKEEITGTVFDIQRYSLGDGAGIRTTVFMKGCNLRCRWCQNPESLKPEPEAAYRKDRCVQCGACGNNAGGVFDACPTNAKYTIGKEYTTDALLSIILQDCAFYEASGGGVTISGGEATRQHKFIRAFLQVCKQSQLHTALETNGCYDREQFCQTLPYLDRVFFDIKCISPENHLLFAGVDNRRILDNATWMAEHFEHTTFRMPAVPGMTFTHRNIHDMAQFLLKIKVERIELCLYQSAWEKKLTWLDTQQQALGLSPLTLIDAEWAIALFETYGISAIPI